MKFINALFLLFLVTLTNQTTLKNKLSTKAYVFVNCKGVDESEKKDKSNSCRYLSEKPGSECYDLISCERNSAGNCDWRINKDFNNCMKQYD